MEQAWSSREALAFASCPQGIDSINDEHATYKQRSRAHFAAGATMLHSRAQKPHSCCTRAIAVCVAVCCSIVANLDGTDLVHNNRLKDAAARAWKSTSFVTFAVTNLLGDSTEIRVDVIFKTRHAHSNMHTHSPTVSHTHAQYTCTHT